MQVSVRGALLYSKIQCLHTLSPMYQFSMNWFQKIFCECLLNQPSSKCLEAHLASIIETLTLTVLRRISFSVSADHYTPFVFQLCCALCLSDDSCSFLKVCADEWITMLKLANLLSKNTNSGEGRESNQKNSSSEKSRMNKPACIEQRAWDAVSLLEKQLQCFKGLQRHISKCSEQWAGLSNSSAPTAILQIMTEHDDFSPSLLTDFQQLLILQVFCSNRFSIEVQHFISKVLGEQWQTRPAVSLSDVLSTTEHEVPILLLVSGGEFHNHSACEHSLYLNCEGMHVYL